MKLPTLKLTQMQVIHFYFFIVDIYIQVNIILEPKHKRSCRLECKLRIPTIGEPQIINYSNRQCCQNIWRGCRDEKINTWRIIAKPKI